MRERDIYKLVKHKTNTMFASWITTTLERKAKETKKKIFEKNEDMKMRRSKLQCRNDFDNI